MVEAGGRPIRILLVEDSDIDAELLSGHLAKDQMNVAVRRVFLKEDFLDALKKDEFDVILSDFSLLEFDGLTALALARERRPLVPFIFVSGLIGEEFATNALKRGATDYILKRNFSRVHTAIERALADARQQAVARAAVSALRLSEQNLQTALKAGNFGTWSLDLRTEELVTSDVCKVNFGRALDAPFSYQDLRNAVHPDDRARMQTAVRASIATGVDYDIEYRIVTAANETRWVVVRGRAIREEDGAPTAMAGVSADITTRKRLEQDLLNLNEDLERRVEARTAELVQAQEDLRQSQKMEAVGQLTGGIAHDFNNLLTGITGSLDLIGRRLEAGRTDGIDRFMEAAKASANRAAALTHRLLAFARRQSLLTEAQDVNAIVQGMEELFRRTLGETIVLETALDADLWPAMSDANQLENALLNLVINARDAMPKGGRLIIATAGESVDDALAARWNAAPGDYVMLAVTDTGMGMAADVLAKAFDPFFTTKPIGQGTGLGLSMIYGFAKQSGGFVSLESRIGVGTTVCIFLPRATAADLKPADENAPPATDGAGETVLVVEDDPTVRLLIIEVLQELGYRHVEAEDAAGAIPVLQSDLHLDLLVTDVGLPNMNGRQLAEIARQHRPTLKILFVTGYAEGAAHREGFLEPGMSMMTKPFDLGALGAKIRDLMQV